MSPDDLGAREVELLGEQGKLFIPLAAQLTDPDSSPPVPFGLPELDTKLGGGLRRGLHLLVGYQHSGKTQLLLRLIWQNRDRPSVLFTMDEDVDRVTNKLIALVTGIRLGELMEMPKVEKQGYLHQYYPKLAVCEVPLYQDEIFQYLREVEDYFGEKPAFAAYDYLEHFATSRGADASSAVKQAAKKLKSIAKQSGMPWVVVHQLNRQGAYAAPIRTTMITQGGEQEGDCIIGVWREIRLENPPRHVVSQNEQQPTIHVSIMKNKQTYDYYDNQSEAGREHAIVKETGMIREMKATDRVHTNTNVVWQDQRGYARD